MLAAYVRRANIGGVCGWIMMTIGAVQSQSHRSAAAPIGVVILVIGAALFVWACAQYAMAKGHSMYWGALGLLWLPGFLVLYFLSDRHKAPRAA